MTKSKVFSITAFVCGIVGVVCPFLKIGIMYSLMILGAAIVGMVFGALGMRGSYKTNIGKGFAIAGLALGIIGTVFCGFGLTISTVVAKVENAIEDRVERIEERIDTIEEKVDAIKERSQKMEDKIEGKIEDTADSIVESVEEFFDKFRIRK